MNPRLLAHRLRRWLGANRRFLAFLLLLGIFRTAVADYNPVPSGSMRPTIVEGDVILVNRLAYDLKLPLTDLVLTRLGEPARGDIATFVSPRDGARLVKRLVAVPGDRVEGREGVLFINGVAASYESIHAVTEALDARHVVRATRATERWASKAHAVQYLPEYAAYRNFGPITVTADHYFAMGDSRDNSLDSRVIGLIPRTALIGRAHHILLSWHALGDWREAWRRSATTLQ